MPQSFRSFLMEAPEIIQRFLGPTFLAATLPCLQYSLTVASVTSSLSNEAASLALYQPSVLRDLGTDVDVTVYRNRLLSKCFGTYRKTWLSIAVFFDKQPRAFARNQLGTSYAASGHWTGLPDDADFSLSIFGLATTTHRLTLSAQTPGLVNSNHLAFISIKTTVPVLCRVPA